MGTGMCKEVSPVAGREDRAWASGGCRETVDRALERILRRKTQVIHGSGLHTGTSALKNGSHLRSPGSPKNFLVMEQVKSSGLKGHRSPPLGDAPFTEVPLPTPPPQREDAQISDTPPVRPPRKKDRMKPKLPFPRRNQSAHSLPAQGGIPEEAAARLESYIKRCHSFGTVPVLIEEMIESGHVSSLSSLSTSTLDSSAASASRATAARDRPGDRLPSFASVTPPPSPSSTPPDGHDDGSPRLPRFFIGSRGRSASSSSAHDPPSPMSPSVVSFWDHVDERKGLSPPPHYPPSDASKRRMTPVTDRREVKLDHRALRRVKSQGSSESQPQHQRNTDYVSTLSENVIDMLPTSTSGPPAMPIGRARSSPHIATGPRTPRVGFEIDRNNPRTILLRILGEYQCLPGSGALAREGKTGEEEELAALEKQLDGKRAFTGKKKSKGEDGEDQKGKGKKEKRKEGGEDDDDDDSSSVTPSLGELEEALAQMLDEDDWEEKEEERMGMAVEERMREAMEARIKAEGDAGTPPAMSPRMNRENTFMALSELSRDE